MHMTFGYIYPWSQIWMNANFLLIISDKAEVEVFEPDYFKNTLSRYLVTLDSIFSTFVALQK